MCRLQAWLRSIMAILVMRVCMSVSFNTICTIKITEYTWNAKRQTCTYERKSRGELYVFQIIYYLVEFFIPALGGLAVDKWFGELKVLRVAGMLLLISSLYMTVVEMGKLICYPMVYTIGLVPGCLAYGVGVAPLVAVPQKLTQAHFGSATPGLLAYYFAAALGEFIGYLPQYARPTTDITWVVCIASVLYIAASAILDLDWAAYNQRFQHQLEYGFQLPTRNRSLRYFVLLAPIILMVSVIATAHAVTYCLEMNLYLNCTGNCTAVTCVEVFGAYDISTMLTILVLGTLYVLGYLSKEGRINARFYLGALVLMLSKAALIPWNYWAAAQPNQPDPNLTHIVYGTASALDGIANGLGLASGYELMYRIAPAHSKNFVMGLMFTVWSVGPCITGIMYALLSRFPAEHPVLQPIFAQWNVLYVVYVVMSIEVALVIVYYRIFCARLAPTMITLDEYLDISESGENSPHQRLVDPADTGQAANTAETL